MGTSVSHPSPRTTIWRAVSTCYESDQVPIDRTAEEIWHAATAETSTIESQIKSPAVFACYELAREKVPADRIQAALSKVASDYGNSMALEYAKRATLIASQRENPGEQWPKLFFRELTGYFVSRDASGYVGLTSRSKTVGDLIALKRSVGNDVEQKVGNLRLAPRTASDWSRDANVALTALRKNK